MARPFAKSFYKSKEWQAVRSYVLKRDLYLCKKCGEPAEEVHHIIHLTPDNITDISISLNPENLDSLCKNCHFDEHKEERIAARCNGNDATIKKLMKYENGGIALVASNPMYPPMHFSEQEIMEMPVQIIGKVVELRAKF